MKTTVIVKLEIDGSASDAFHVVDSLLDAGFFQDAINEHDVEDCGPLHVTSAMSEAAPATQEVRTTRGAPTSPEMCETCGAEPGEPCVWMKTTIPRFMLHRARRGVGAGGVR